MRFLFTILMMMGFSGWLSCGGGTVQENEQPKDSQLVAEHVDPSTQFPRQLVEADSLQTDVHFVANALQRAGETIALADMATRKASRPEVKAVAQKIGDEQRQLYSGLQKLQKDREKVDSMPAFNDGSRKELEQLSGKTFDERWVEKMVTWNAAGISRYLAESRAVKEKDVKKLVTDVLPVLKANQQQLESCRAKP